MLVFEKQGDGSWAKTREIIATDTAAGDGFGSPVALFGTRAIVGAYGAEAAYIMSVTAP